MVDSLGNVGEALSDARVDSLADLYDSVDLQVCYEPTARTADVSIHLGRRVKSECVRRGT